MLFPDIFQAPDEVRGSYLSHDPELRAGQVSSSATGHHFEEILCANFIAVP